ncbi:universal stress protein UspE [Vibrio sp. SS-MA-C1-2]|uniref:universal stress protein UspE n=1 Tax=Vibrio sp. SS-MA-C1-2 TaxID=2908646 RepID=UPI001F3A1CD7|nr:universal stress protein UspE [Vibrio sp. SS-MA-C1-2]UJF18113.1 universal stress protein UspE [Vibrio sp. SS-MA-C1-2]
MDKYSNILVVANTNHESQPALSRAAYLAKKQENVSITLFLAIYDFSYEMTSMLSSDERDAMRKGMIQQQKSLLAEYCESYPELNIDIHVIWHNRHYEAIIDYVHDKNIDLVMKASRHHDILETIIFTPTDWHLLRKCPCPVLLVKDHEWPEGGNILTSVNIATEDDNHHLLNDKLVKESLEISQLVNGNVNLVNAYPATPANIVIEIPEFDPSSYTDAVRGHHLTSMKALRQKFSLAEEDVHVLEGIPEEIIPQVAEKIDAELVVLGTIGRTGLSAAFIGNTAEQTIDQLNCDLLAIKPDGYISPLKPETKIED